MTDLCLICSDPNRLRSKRTFYLWTWSNIEMRADQSANIAFWRPDGSSSPWNVVKHDWLLRFVVCSQHLCMKLCFHTMNGKKYFKTCICSSDSGNWIFPGLSVLPCTVEIERPEVKRAMRYVEPDAQESRPFYSIVKNIWYILLDNCLYFSTDHWLL